MCGGFGFIPNSDAFSNCLIFQLNGNKNNCFSETLDLQFGKHYFEKSYMGVPVATAQQIKQLHLLSVNMLM